MGLYVTETSGPEVVKLSSDLYEYFRLDTVQDFLIKLGIKPRMHLLEINIFHYIMYDG